MKPRRINALRSLIERPGTPAEGAAAKATLERILARGAAHTAAVRAEQKRPITAAAQGPSQSKGHGDYEEKRRRRAQKGRPRAGVKQFIKRGFRLFVIATLLIAFEFFFGLNWHARNNATIKETGQQQGIHSDPLHPAPGRRPLLQYDPIDPGSPIKRAQ